MGRGKPQRRDVVASSSTTTTALRCASGPPQLTNGAARNLLRGFDVKGDESMEYLASLVTSGTAPREAIDELYSAGLMAAAEDWDLTLACAVAMNKQQRRQQLQRPRHSCGIDDHRLLRGNSNIHLFACLDKVFGRESSHLQEESPAAAKEQAAGKDQEPKGSWTSKRKRQIKSPYWTDEPLQLVAEPPLKRAKVEIKEEHGTAAVALDSSALDDATSASPPPPQKAVEKSDLPRSTGPAPRKPLPSSPPTPTVKTRGAATSRHFGGGTPTPSAAARPTMGQQSVLLLEDKSPRKRASSRPPGAPAVSGLPFPPLTAPRFGLIQEELAHDPFQLMVAVRLLIKTAGRAAIPAFRRLTERYPSAADVAAADPEELLDMIRHLGLGIVRRDAIMRYARIWVAKPPSREVRYGVKHYPRRGDAKDVKLGEKFGPEDEEDESNDDHDEAVRATSHRGLGSAWEIGHITQGSYAIDSWRIFCRDELLGRTGPATGDDDDDDDDGQQKNKKKETSITTTTDERKRRSGGKGEFQPEWMRVQPADKELRAYLRWMWMREGWDWDPETGEREVLSEELRRAVDEGRVGYDDHGRLRIVS
ncbi:hypothetical protein MAPG_08263 [Magnaporthiopsis poae ATCC 64411]|uniref:HhH-GPD domain-containing protein n=1 Tax=Magnaporthiopsis poae (strain ATCC 64411 / 73-15) TaxID=644358 RepID=A0A0C4E6W6_MAGP6|nr:hypothetical protein MAPG_08263 [Magnaporthiopsis poae ATCC 64411]